MIIAIASKRGPKIDAVKTFFGSAKHMFAGLSAEINYLTYEIEDSIVMPRSLDELMNGSRHRVEQLQQIVLSRNEDADYYIGMEGGFHTIRSEGKEMVFLQSWAYVSDGSLGFYGSSGNVYVPEKIAEEVMRNKRDLSEVIDEFANQVDVRSKQGTWGILTRDLLTRRQSFEIALAAAFAPFYNREMYK